MTEEGGGHAYRKICTACASSANVLTTMELNLDPAYRLRVPGSSNQALRKITKDTSTGLPKGSSQPSIIKTLGQIRSVELRVRFMRHIPSQS